MKWKPANLQTRLYVIAAILLSVGLGSAVLIYAAAENEAGEAVGYDFVDGNAYSIAPETSKMYVHNLELYGGKAAVFGDQLNRWFNGLWHGKSLAYTVVWIAIVISSGLFLVARQMPFDSQSDATDKINRNETDKT